jgi:hypothetical protein
MLKKSPVTGLFFKSDKFNAQAYFPDERLLFELKPSMVNHP